jgi:hypothetical protein
MNPDAAAAVLAQVVLAIRARLKNGTPSPIVRYELEALLRIATAEAAHHGVPLP